MAPLISGLRCVHSTWGCGFGLPHQSAQTGHPARCRRLEWPAINSVLRFPGYTLNVVGVERRLPLKQRPGFRFSFPTAAPRCVNQCGPARKTVVTYRRSWMAGCRPRRCCSRCPCDPRPPTRPPRSLTRGLGHRGQSTGRVQSQGPRSPVDEDNVRWLRRGIRSGLF